MEQFYNKIESYLAGDMPKTEAEAFEQQIAQQPELKEAVEAHQLSYDAVELLIEDSLRSELKDLEKKHYPQKAKIRSLKRSWVQHPLSIAASVLLLIGAFGLWWANDNFSNPNLVGKYYTPELLTSRSIDDKQDPLNVGLKAIQDKRYIEAATFFQAVPTDSDNYQKALYFLGHTFFQQGDFAQAKENLEKAIQGSDPNLVDKAEWLNILTLLKAGETSSDHFKTLLQKMVNEPGHSFHKKALELEQKLNSGWRKVVF